MEQRFPNQFALSMKILIALAHISAYNKKEQKLLWDIWFGHRALAQIFDSRRLYRHLNLIHEWTMFTVPNDKVSTFGQVLHKTLFQLILEIHRF